MKKQILLLFFLIILVFGVQIFTSSSSWGKVHPCLRKEHRICNMIHALNPKLNLNTAFKYSNIFYKVAKKYKLSPILLTAIAYQESRFELGIVRKTRGYAKIEDQFVYIDVGSDFCMMQINSYNVHKRELDVSKLLEDPEYCINAGAKILLEFKKRYASYDDFWWTRYNASSDIHRRYYHQLVSRHISTIKHKTDDEEAEEFTLYDHRIKNESDDGHS